MKENSYPFPIPIGPRSVLSKRAEILATLLASDDAFCAIPVKGISSDSLALLLALYDTSFFSGCLKRLNIRVTLSSRMTSSAGKFVFSRSTLGRIKQAEIRMSSDFLLRLHQGPFELNGLTVSTPQEAFLLVFEHELCHAAETLLFGATGHSDRFLSLANGLFGHTETRHKLPTRRQEAARSGLNIGGVVSFVYQGKKLSGIVTYIGKTATVMVPSPRGQYLDRSAKRYEKYRVPLSRIQ